MKERTDTGRDARQAVLKNIIKDLHAGVPVDDLKKTFARIIQETSPEEIADMENALIQEGFPPEEIQRLCDVHAQVFDKALRKAGKPGKVPGHPIYTYRQENKEAKAQLNKLKHALKPFGKKEPSAEDVKRFTGLFVRFKDIEKHYARKENQLFPVLEAKGFSGPTKVMWGKHDEIRAHLRTVDGLLKSRDWGVLAAGLKTLATAVKKLIFLEEKILFPTAARKLDNVDWARIKNGEPEIGYAWVKPSDLWDARLAQAQSEQENYPMEKTPSSPVPAETTIALSQGQITPAQVDLILKHLPVDITYVDENDQVRYYSDTKERLFPRSPAIIGRAVQNCHPPKSLHIVNNIVAAFKEKKKDVAEFWIQRAGQFILIRYFPVYDEAGVYRGVLEVSQEISRMKKLEGEKRLLDWK